jgi:hypothetical protein
MIIIAIEWVMVLNGGFFFFVILTLPVIVWLTILWIEYNLFGLIYVYVSVFYCVNLHLSFLDEPAH